MNDKFKLFKLEPCPLCGSDAEPNYDGDYYADNEFSIRCTNSDCELLLPADAFLYDGNFVMDEKYIHNWNRRNFSK